MKRAWKRFTACCLVVLLLVCLLPCGSISAAEASVNRITVSFRLIGAEQATRDVDLGEDPYLPAYVTWIPTTTYELNAGATVYDLWVLATGETGIRSVGADRNYVKTVYAPDKLGGYSLSEFANGRRSGWMYTINGRHPGYGLKEQTLHDGDAVIWHYVNDYSYEIDDWYNEGSWQALGDGSYYNLWLKAPDRFGGVSLAITDISENKTAAHTSEAITWTVTATGGSGMLEYCFRVYKDGTLVKKGTYGQATKYKYTPEEPGAYKVKVYVRDAAGTVVSQKSSSITVTPSAVPVLSNAKVSAGQIQVKWSAVNGATKYAVYRKALGKTSWTRLTNTFTGTTYTDKSADLIAGTTYYYTVRAYVNGVWGGYDKTGISATASAVPVLTSAKASAGQIQVKWNVVNGATKYAVYRKATGDTSWTRLTKTFTGTDYKDKSADLIAGTTYYYTVRAYVNSAWGGYDKTGVSAVASAVPVLASATAATGQITVKWKAVNGATKYAVYRKAAGETSWTRLTKTFTGTTYTDKSADLVAGTSYSYTVRAYVDGTWSGYNKAGVNAKA